MAYQMQNVLEVDWEVSAVVDLTEVGAHRYSRDPGTVCYQAWFSFHHWDTGQVTEVEWRLGWPMPIAVMECLNRGYHIAAHNREFEACIWNNHMCKVHGWPPIPIDSGICTAAVAAANGLPRTLDAVAKVRNYAIKKDSVGNAVMKVIMRNWGQPLARGATIKEYKDGPVVFKFKKGDVPSVMPEVLDRVSDYCRDDVRSENQILKDDWMYPLSPFEYRVWQNDCRINWRGAYIDRVLLEACIQTYELMKQHYALMLMQLSQGRITSAGADAEVLAEARYYNVPMTNNTIEMRADFIASEQTPEQFKNILRCIGSLKKTSCSKFYSMRESICEDGRVRGLLVYCGAARTGRWASRLIQLQNLTGNADLQDSDYEIILEFCRARDYKGLIALFGWRAMDALSWCIRPLICAAPGMELADADYSAIEARVIAWLAGEQWRLDFFNYTPDTWPESSAMYHEQVAQGLIQPGQWPKKEGSTFKPDIYIKSYSETFNVPYQQVTKKQRKVGKVEELALGYMGGVGAMLNFGADKLGMSEVEMNDVKNKWRDANQAIKALWYKMEEAAINAVLTPGYEFGVNNLVSFFVNGPYLHMRLPSGRLLHYYQPEVKFELNQWGKWANKLYYWGRKSDQGGANEGNKWTQLDTYGGKLCIAEGTPVLTKLGWKAIEKVTASDLVWDGDEWVQQDGAVLNGEKEVIEAYGGWMTHDHKVLTEDGWKDASQSKRHKRADSRIPDGIEVPRIGRETVPMGDSMRLWESDTDGPLAVQETDKEWERVIVRMYAPTDSGCPNDVARNVEASGVPRTSGYGGEVQKANSPRLAQLRRARDNSLPTVAGVRKLLGGHGADVRTGPNVRSQGQHEGVLSRELSLGDAIGAGAKYPKIFGREVDIGRAESCRVIPTHRPEEEHNTLSAECGRESGPDSGSTRRFAKVYDLVNCGPRNRFVIATENGTLIVHNCENAVQAIARDLMAAALLRAEANGFNTIFHVHDEMVNEQPEGTTDMKAFIEIMSENPAWAGTMPVTAAGWVGKRFKKD